MQKELPYVYNEEAKVYDRQGPYQLNFMPRKIYLPTLEIMTTLH